MNGQAKPPTMAIIVTAPITSYQRTAVNIWQVHDNSHSQGQNGGSMTAVLNKVLLANCRADEECKMLMRKLNTIMIDIK